MIIKRLQKWKQQIDKELAQEIKFFRRTNIFEKIAASAINVIFISIVAIPTYFYLGWTLKFKIAVGLIFFIGSLFFHLQGNGQCPGMKILKTHWEKKYNKKQKVIYSVLYTLSFSTMLIWLYFPLDVFIINMLSQMITILFTGTTLHGYITGKMHTVKHK